MLDFLRIQLKRVVFILPRVVGWYARTFFMLVGTGRVRREPEYYEALQEDVHNKWQAILEDDREIREGG